MNFIITREKKHHYILIKIEEINSLQNDVLKSETSQELKVNGLLAFLHKLRGGAKTFGFQKLGDAAGTLEQTINSEYTAGKSVDVQKQIELLLINLNDAKLECN